MTLGPTSVLQCPDSTEVVLLPSLRSGNTIGAQFWSDGYAKMPMMIRFPEITRCGTNGKIFWVEDVKKLGELDDQLRINSPDFDAEESRQRPNPKWENAPTVRFLSEKECFEALDSGLAKNKDLEIRLRRQAFWAGNDQFRQEKSRTPFQKHPLFEHAKAKENAEKLLALLDEKEAPVQLMKAELLRELGRFDESIQILDKIKDEQLQAAKQEILTLAKKKDALVRTILEETSPQK